MGYWVLYSHIRKTQGRKVTVLLRYHQRMEQLSIDLTVQNVEEAKHFDDEEAAKRYCRAHLGINWQPKYIADEEWKAAH